MRGNTPYVPPFLRLFADKMLSLRHVCREETEQIGSTSVRVMQKVHGKRKSVKVIGCSSDIEEIGLLIKRGNRWIEEHRNGMPLFELEDEAVAYDKVLANLRQSQLRLVGQVTVAFYDTSTLYFESQEDDVRIPGYSKDGKSESPQVVLGLLVGTGGNPIGYELHKGSQYEGTTLLPIVKRLEKRFKLFHPMIVADAGLLSEKNIEQLEEDGYEYIIGARIRSMSKPDKEVVLGLGLKDGELASLTLKGKRHVISMSESRAKKDAKDREKGIRRLEKRFASGKITKTSVNNRGYNRFLSLQGETTVTIDHNKIAEDTRLDGLKGYVTNSKIKDEEVAENYRNLHFIERAFRMNKTDLAIRPIYHRLFNRIEAHVCICFTAYTILLELERTLRKTADKKNKKNGITIYRAKFLAESLYEIEYVNPYNGKKMSVMLRTDYDEEVVKLLDAIGLKP